MSSANEREQESYATLLKELEGLMQQACGRVVTMLQTSES